MYIGTLFRYYTFKIFWDLDSKQSIEWVIIGLGTYDIGNLKKIKIGKSKTNLCHLVSR